MTKFVALLIKEETRQAEDAEKKKDKNGSTVVAATDQQCTK